MSMQVVKKPPPLPARDANKTQSSVGRPPNNFFDLLHPHPLAEEYVIKQKSKFDVPILVGAPPPRQLSNVTGKSKLTESQKKHALRHASYYTALFVPWHASTIKRIDPSPRGWEKHLSTLRKEAEVDAVDGIAAAVERIAQGRLFRVQNVAKALITSTSKTKTMTQWRSRNRTLWHDLSDMLLQGNRESKKRVSAEEEIEEIKKQAAQRADPRAMHKALRMETWAEENFEPLTKVLSSISSSLARPPWPSNAPDKHSSPVISLHRDQQRWANVLQRITEPREKPEAPKSSPRSCGGDSSSEPPEFLEIDQHQFQIETSC